MSLHAVSSRLSALPPGRAAWPEKLLKLAALMVMTTLRSPQRSAYSRMSTAARFRTGSSSHSGKGGGV